MVEYDNMTAEAGDFRTIIVNGVQHRDRVRVRYMSSLKSWCPGVSSRLKASPSCSKLITAEDTEIPRSRSTAIQSERTRRRSPRAFTSPRQLDRTVKQQQYLGQCGLAGVRVRNNRKVPPAQNFVRQAAH